MGGVVMTDYVKAWQCIGCGKIEAPQTCIGICQDRKVQFVYASEHEEVLVQARHAQQRADVLEALVRQLANDAAQWRVGKILPGVAEPRAARHWSACATRSEQAMTTGIANKNPNLEAFGPRRWG